MMDDELIKLSRENLRKSKQGSLCECYDEAFIKGYRLSEKRIEELKAQVEQLQKVNSEQKETLKKVRIALIQERTANIMNYGKGGVEMFDDILEVLKEEVK